MDGCWLITATAKIVKNRLWLIFDNFGIVLFAYPWKTFLIRFIVTDFPWIISLFRAENRSPNRIILLKKRDKFYEVSIRLFKRVTRSIANIRPELFLLSMFLSSEKHFAWESFKELVERWEALNRRFGPLKRFCVKLARSFDGFDTRGIQFRCFDEA